MTNNTTFFFFLFLVILDQCRARHGLALQTTRPKTAPCPHLLEMGEKRLYCLMTIVTTREIMGYRTEHDEECKGCKRIIRKNELQYDSPIGRVCKDCYVKGLPPLPRSFENKLPNVPLHPEVNKAILWQKDEVFVNWVNAQEFFEDRTQTFGARVGHKGFLVLTNQRIIFACKLGFMASDYAITYGISLEDIMSISPGKFGLNDKLVVLERSGQHRDFIQPKINIFIPLINTTISERRSQLEAKKDKERIQVVLDFSSLKEVMTKGGVVMSSANCPNCNAMVEIPESGKVLICKYCGAPIKPVDIFERIKSLLQ